MNPSEQSFSAYITVTISYWAFMLTDGALRMLVLLHFHTLGFSPITLAYLFLLYEVMGIITNLSAGWLAVRYGLNATLFAGLSLQIIALFALAQLDASWGLGISVVFVMLVQGLSGIAKDLAKMSAKSAVKLLSPDQGDGLFKWVAMLTGSKNAVKGLGFFLGAGFLGVAGFHSAVIGMAVFLGFILLAVILFMPKGLSGGKRRAAFSEVFSRDKNVNRLSAARMFLFGARDTWFVVAVPVFFYQFLSANTALDERQSFFAIGIFMAAWVIFYGVIQALAPRLIAANGRSVAEIATLAQKWVGVLLVLPVILAIAALGFDNSTFGGGVLIIIIVLGLLLFGLVFAINSSIHSYLILAFSKDSNVAMNVGFYYMSNAAGRLLGTFLSGLSYQLGGLALCLGTTAVMTALSWGFVRRLNKGLIP